MRGFWHSGEGDGLGDGPEGLQRALNALGNQPTGQSMMPFDRR